MPLDESSNPGLTNTDWPSIDLSLLGEARSAPPSFPLHILPGNWRAWVEVASRIFGSADYLAHCLLGGVAGVCGAGTQVQIAPHWREPLLLWQAMVGGPSSGKSAAFARVRALLAEVKPQPDTSDRAAPSVLVNAGLNQLSLALLSSDRGVLLWHDDLADWMQEASQRTARLAWLAGWNAGSTLIGATPERCFAIGIMGALSSAQLAPGFADGDNGLAARFLYVWPDIGPGRACACSLAGAEYDDEGIVALMQKIANFAGDRVESPGIVPLDEDATRRMEALMAALRQQADQRQADGAEGVEAEWIARGVPTIARLAGLLSLMQWADESREAWLPAGEAHVEAAYELWSTYYLPHALDVFGRSGVAGCEGAARRVTRWLRRLRASEISREDVRRQALCQTVNAEGAEDVLARLEAGGVLRQIEIATAGRTRRRWQVNPALR